MKAFKLVIIITMSILIAQSCQQPSKSVKPDKTAVNNLMDQWHKDVAQFDYNAYFNALSDDAVFIGTDAFEIWTKQQFMTFSKPYFDKQQTWHFKPLERHINFYDNGLLAWFDETLDTWMGICRGSGIVAKQNDKWLIKQYVLSMTIPNEVSKEVVELKKVQDSIYLSK